MNDQIYASRQDRAIESESADLLDRGPFIESLIRALVVDKVDADDNLIGKRATGYVVGLTGQWGLGKSSVLNLLAKNLSQTEDVIVAVFNPWLFKGRDELVTGFFNSLRGAMGSSKGEKARTLMGYLDKYWGALTYAGHGVAAVIDVHGGGGLATATWETVKDAPHDLLTSKVRTPEEERRSLEGKIQSANCAVVVLIDELDRVEDDEVRAVAQLVKAVGDIKGISYLVAYDPERVVQALGRGSGDERRKSGERYLEKIIQHPIPLRPLFVEDAGPLLNAALADNGIKIEEPYIEGQNEIYNLLLEDIRTPREIKRLIGAFSVVEHATKWEINAFDVLGFLWAVTKSPTLYDRIASKIDQLVDDPSDKEMISRSFHAAGKGGDPDIEEILGEAAIPHRALLELLFPRFIKNKSVSGGSERLSRRQNLVRMLYMGNPPGAIRRVDVERLWATGDATALGDALQSVIAEEKLGPILDRLEDLLPALPSSGDAIFWPSLSMALCRPSDRLTGPDTRRALAMDAISILQRFALRDKTRLPRLMTIIDTLISSGDLVLVPGIIRVFQFAHGLTVPPRPARNEAAIESKQTEKLISREVPRYRKAVLDGTILRKLPNLEVVFVLVNAGQWDEELKSSLTSQLSSAEATYTLAGLLVPPGYVMDRDDIARLVDVEKTLKIVDQIDLVPEDRWLAESFRRFKAVLKGGDLTFDGLD